MAEAGWDEVKQPDADAPHRRASILRGPHGRFRFDAFRWRKYYEPSMDDFGAVDGGWWDCDHRSGLYETSAVAEAGARRELPRLRPRTPTGPA